MVGMNAKKREERAKLELLRSVYPDFPSGKIEESEGPDFLVRGAVATVGIELVDYVSSSPERGQEERRDRILRAAQAAYEARHADILWVVFFWHSGVQLTQASGVEFPPLIADLVNRFIP